MTEKKNDLSGQDEILRALAHCTSLVLLGGGTAVDRVKLLLALKQFMFNAVLSDEMSLQSTAISDHVTQEDRIQHLYDTSGGEQCVWNLFYGGLSLRTQRVLARGRICSLKDLVDCTEMVLLGIKCCGPVTLNEIKTQLRNLGLELC